MEIKNSYFNQTYIDEIKGEVNWDAAKCKAIKEHIRDYLYSINMERCFFCKSHIKEGTVEETIEHIVSKDNYPIFTFKPENLTISCHDCNRIKNNKETFDLAILKKEELIALRYDEYPFKKEYYTIVHPYLDKYNECIDFDGLIYVGKNNKGTNTIEMYDLFRGSLVENNSKVNEGGYSLINKIFNAEVNVEEYFAYGRLIKYIGTKSTTKEKWTSEVIEILKNINNIDVHTFKLFKSLACSYSDSSEQQIKSSDFFTITNVNRGVDCVEKVLYLLRAMTKKVEDRRYISTLIDIDFNLLENMYLGKDRLLKNNERIQITLKFKHLIELIKIYDLGYGLEEILKAIDADFRVLGNIKLKLIPIVVNK